MSEDYSDVFPYKLATALARTEAAERQTKAAVAETLQAWKERDLWAARAEAAKREVDRLNEVADNYDGMVNELQMERDAAYERGARETLRDCAEAADCKGRFPLPSPWQSIETAPKDGSEVILAVVGGHSSYAGFWHDGRECRRGEAGFFAEADRGRLLNALNVNATRWMPLPHPPGEEG